MYIFFYVSIIVFIIGIIFFIIGTKKGKQTVDEIIEQRRAQIERSLQTQLLDTKHRVETVYNELQSLESERDQVARERKVEIERLADIRRERDAMIQREVQHLQEQLDLNQKLKLQQLDLDYKKKSEELIAKYDMQREVLEEELAVCKSDLDQFRSIQESINEAIRLAEELENESNTHRIILNDFSKDDIHYLISIEPNIHNQELLRKLIWTEYIQQPFNQMILNSFGSHIPRNVIYCIENKTTHKKYIGKTSAEVSKRWTEHIKSSLNIGGIKKQKIHDALFNHWDEFLFYIIEEVKDGKLSEREKYYIQFYETDKYGYNLKGGG